MKKILFLLLAGVLTVSGVAAQEFEEVKGVFEEFANDLSSALPFASTLGVNWSDSFIGHFMHLGVGLTVGAVGLPAEAFGNVLGTLTGGASSGAASSSAMNWLMGRPSTRRTISPTIKPKVIV